jgi:predicted metalloprotease with PDZ domain
LVGLCLDLKIRQVTAGRYSLDDVMRALFNDFYKRGKGFTTEDMIGVINRLTGQDYHDFYRRYVFGVEVPPYDQILGYAGYRAEKKTRQVSSFGLEARFGGGGIRVQHVNKGSGAEAAGVLAGDIITRINGQEPFRVPFNKLAGQTVKMTIKREGEEKDFNVKIGSRDETEYTVVELPQTTPEQTTLREAWLKIGR